ncbi:hypothetical protein [Actinacidiphila acididurans]|uniref:DNA-directed RNA polymerase specialized sigma24 family protein n=1 Tax=Actinacidiphila acididurans TaxID=2784346 RepID=A0ABS2TMX4_9ACTN|nr:hypothetical protein [Actinacidiphila acididurans]MBM9504690.1 hypothetical protein [Actinacidiphila acididurans]
MVPRTGEGARAAFDALYTATAGTLLRQTRLLGGDDALALRAVGHAFRLAWQRWPELARDSDPVGWVRLAAYDFTLAPWQRWLRGRWQVVPAPQSPLEAALLDLSPARRRAVLLHDGLGLNLGDVAVEVQATTMAAASRVVGAREELAAAMATENGAEAVSDAPGAGTVSAAMATEKAAESRAGSTAEGEAEDPRGPGAQPAPLAPLLRNPPEPPQAPAVVREESEREAQQRATACLLLAGLVGLVVLIVMLLGSGSRHAHGLARDSAPAAARGGVTRTAPLRPHAPNGHGVGAAPFRRPAHAMVR